MMLRIQSQPMFILELTKDEMHAAVLAFGEFLNREAMSQNTLNYSIIEKLYALTSEHYNAAVSS